LAVFTASPNGPSSPVAAIFMLSATAMPPSNGSSISAVSAAAAGFRNVEDFAWMPRVA